MQFRQKIIFGGVVLMAVLATVIDFTSRLLSVLVDGTFMVVLLTLVWHGLRSASKQK